MIKRMSQIFNARGGQQLCDAAAVGNARILSDLLAKGANHAFSDFHALSLATSGGFAECVKILVAREHPQQSVRDNFLSALLSGRVECALILSPLIVHEAPRPSGLRRQFSSIFRHGGGSVSFAEAFNALVRRGDAVGARLLLPHVADDVALLGLRQAAWRGHSECIELLLPRLEPGEDALSLSDLAALARSSLRPDAALPIEALILSIALSKTTPQASAEPSNSPQRPRL